MEMASRFKLNCFKVRPEPLCVRLNLFVIFEKKLKIGFQDRHSPAAIIALYRKYMGAGRL